MSYQVLFRQVFIYCIVKRLYRAQQCASDVVFLHISEGFFRVTLLD